jgi:hypothetical protein
MIGAQPRTVARGLTKAASGPVGLRGGVGKIPSNTWVSEDQTTGRYSGSARCSGTGSVIFDLAQNSALLYSRATLHTVPALSSLKEQGDLFDPHFTISVMCTCLFLDFAILDKSG